MATSAPPALAAAPASASTSAWLWVALALLVLVSLSLIVAVRWRRRRRRLRRRKGEARPKHPVVLAHGLMGFDSIGVGPLKGRYFRGIERHLTARGCVLHRPVVAPAGSVQSRARELAAQIEALPAPRVNIVAHSMGGLDARYAITRLGLGKKVASLVTIGTPHHGTPLADLGTDVLGEKLGLRRALGLVGLELDAFYDLTSTRMAAFNDEVRNARGVAYASIVGVAPRKTRVNPVLLPTYLYLAERVGPNDGLVPTSSQRWGEVLEEVEADHWAQIGWSRHFDAAELYLGLFRELRARGF